MVPNAMLIHKITFIVLVIIDRTNLCVMGAWLVAEMVSWKEAGQAVVELARAAALVEAGHQQGRDKEPIFHEIVGLSLYAQSLTAGA